MIYRDFLLDEFQINAIKEIEKGNSLVLSAPTGSGKTLVAEYLIDSVLKTDKRIIYTSPIKALSNQKFREFSKLYGEKVGILTGDVVINQDAQALIMTTEVYRNMALEDPSKLSNISYVIFDEIHYISDIERGTVWEESIIFSPKHVKFLALSATVPNAAELAKWIESVTEQKVSVITSSYRPVPLSYMFFYQDNLYTFKNLYNLLNKKLKASTDEDYLQEDLKFNSKDKNVKQDKRSARYYRIIEQLRKEDKLPVLYFVFSRALADDLAREAILRFDFTTKAEKVKIREIVNSYLQKYNLFVLESASELAQILEYGVGKHHAGLLPQLKELVEILFSEKLLKVLFVTETFAVGVNMPARTVVFDTLKKYDGQSFRLMKTLEFTQISGRAGRRGIDKKGWVVIPYIKRDTTFEELEQIVYGEVEPLVSQFDLSFNSVLNLYAGHKPEEIKEILKKNFAQFQANKVLPILSERISNIKSLLDKYKITCSNFEQLEDYLKIYKEHEKTIINLKRELKAINKGLKGRKNKRYKKLIMAEYQTKIAQFKEFENNFPCSNCTSKDECIKKALKYFKLQNKLNKLKKKLEEQQELQLPIYEKKLKILKEMGYVDEKGLLPRGIFASKIHIEEITVTELYFKGYFHEINPHELNAVAVSLVYESRRRSSKQDSRVQTPNLTKKLKEIKSYVKFLSKKYRFIKPLNTDLAMVMYEWSKGSSFEEIVSLTDIPEGDIIRYFRQALDLLRQIKEATVDKSLKEKIESCMYYINRDIVLATELRD